MKFRLTAASERKNDLLLGRQGGLRWLTAHLRRSASLGRRRQHEAFADNARNQPAAARPEEAGSPGRRKLRVGPGNPGHQVMNGDGLAVESSLHIRVGCQLDGRDGPGLLGNDGPQVAIVVATANEQQRIERAGVKVWQQNSGTGGQQAELSCFARWQRC